MVKRVARPGVRDGDDRWSSSYDATTNALMDEVPTATKYLDQPGLPAMIQTCCLTWLLVALMAATAAGSTGDVDGDGVADSVRVAWPPEAVRSRMRCTDDGHCPAKLVADLSRLGRRSARLAVGGNLEEPRVLGIVDVDGDGRGEIFVEVGHGASTAFFTIVRVVRDRLEPMIGGTHADFPLGGSVMHFAVVGCTKGEFVTGGWSREGDGASGGMTAYRLDGNALVEVRSRKFEWTCPEAAEECPTFDQIDATGFDTSCPGVEFN
jgi:hypothetical protein